MATAQELIAVTFAPHVDGDVIAKRLDPMIVAMRSPEFSPIMRTHRPRANEALAVVLSASGFGHIDDVDLVGRMVEASLLEAADAPRDTVLDTAAAFLARFLELFSAPD